MNNCDVCLSPTQIDLDRFIYKSKYGLSKFSLEKIKKLYYGYSCDKKSEEKIDMLNRYLSVLEDEYRKLYLGAKECLDKNQLQCLFEKINKISLHCNLDLRSDYSIDKTDFDAWVANNPFCVSREKWEKLAYVVCGIFNLDIIIQKDSADCDIDFDLVAKEKKCDLTFEIIRKTVSCDIIVAISVYKHVCDLNLKISRDEEQCKYDFQILLSETNCNLDFKTYKKLVYDCNMSFDIVKTIYDGGCSITINDDGNPELMAQIDSYDIETMSFSDFPEVEELRKYGVDLSDSEYLKDKDKFINKLKQDYNGR